jgi:hypothetical protein
MNEVFKMYRRLPTLVAMACLLSPLVGCGTATTEAPSHASATDADEHDHDHEGETHDDTPKSYGEAVASLAAFRDTIRDTFAAKDDDKAHELLHEVGHLLEHLPELAQKHSPPIDSAAVKKDADELFGLFGKVDEKMHGAEGATYADVADKIDAVVDRLQKLLPAKDSQALSEAQHP